MNILMIHPHDILSSAEPWTVRIVYLAREFEKKGHTVTLVYFPLEWNGQKASQLSAGITAVPLSRKHGPHVLIANICSVCGLAAKVDIIHFQKCFYNAAIPALIAALIRNKHLHYDWDDWEVKIYEVSTRASFLRNLIRDFLMVFENNIPKVADTVSVASSRLRSECQKLSRHRDTIFNAPVGADLIRFNPAVSGLPILQKYRITQPLILYLGQLHGGQYVELFIRTAAKLLKDYQEDLTFMIVGDGYMAGELKKKSSQLGLDNKLIFTGAIPHELVPQYIAAADVCVACFEENEVTLCKSPLKIVEYLASGKAIVASNVGEVANMLGNAGILVPPGDITALADGIVKIIQDSNLKENLEKRARSRSEGKYSWQATAENLLKAYEKVIH
jgi:glycosyltransferase involved in cell wall biosynthesis